MAELVSCVAGGTGLGGKMDRQTRGVEMGRERQVLKLDFPP
jgi:hypothetical protein